jgi:hypothetical protein
MFPMAHPTLEDARELSDWKPPLGVISVFLGFDPADRGGAWRTELRNGLDCVLEAAKEAEHERRVALRATAKRLTERFEDGDLRPPPRGEAGFVEVAEKGGAEHWWGTGAAPAAPACVELGEGAVLAPLVDLACRGDAEGVVILSAERVRLLRFAEGALEELEDWELNITSGDWRERKSQSGPTAGGAQSGGASGHDQYGERLDHNRHRFLDETGHLAAKALEARGVRRLLVFGPGGDLEHFEHGIKNAPAVDYSVAGETDLISTPTGQLIDTVAAAVENASAQRETETVGATLEEARGGSRGATGRQEIGEALAEGRVEHLVFEAGIDPAEDLVRGALAGNSKITVVHGEELAGMLSEAEGVAAILRY